MCAGAVNFGVKLLVNKVTLMLRFPGKQPPTPSFTSFTIYFSSTVGANKTLRFGELKIE